MNKVQHPSNNGVIGAPKGWDQEELPIHALAITRVQYPGGLMGIQSFWRPTVEELAALNAGKCVVMSILGPVMPAVSLEVTDD